MHLFASLNFTAEVFPVHCIHHILFDLIQKDNDSDLTGNHLRQGHRKYQWYYFFVRMRNLQLVQPSLNPGWWQLLYVYAKAMYGKPLGIHKALFQVERHCKGGTFGAINCLYCADFVDLF